MTLERDKHEARLVPLIPKTLDPDHFITESMLMIWHGLASWLIERRLPLERVHFSYPRPAHADEYDALFLHRSCSLMHHAPKLRLLRIIWICLFAKTKNP